MAAKAIKISCGNQEGFLWPNRFGPAGKSLCIKIDKSESAPWLTPIEFEKRSGKGSQHNWKRTVRSVSHGNKMLSFLIDEGILKVCADLKFCKCKACQLSKEGELTMKVPATSLKAEKQRDTDSDSGISVEIANTSSGADLSTIEEDSPDVMSFEPLTTSEQDKPLPNYTLMVQEAIVALTSGEKNKGINGCSLLGIFLYLLKHYPNVDNVRVMNTKIKSTLGLLKRMGIVNSINDDASDDLEDIFITNNVIENKTPSSGSGAPKETSAKAKSKASKMIVKKAKNFNEKKKKKAGKENSSSENKIFIQKPKRLSPALAALLGKKEMGRHDAVRSIWIYIKKHKLQDPKQKTVIVCDDKLKAVTKKKKVTCSEVLTCLGQNMTAI